MTSPTAIPTAPPLSPYLSANGRAAAMPITPEPTVSKVVIATLPTASILTWYTELTDTAPNPIAKTTRGPVALPANSGEIHMVRTELPAHTKMADRALVIIATSKWLSLISFSYDGRKSPRLSEILGNRTVTIVDEIMVKRCANDSGIA
jgi:hypothetical protein